MTICTFCGNVKELKEEGVKRGWCCLSNKERKLALNIGREIYIRELETKGVVIKEKWNELYWKTVRKLSKRGIFIKKSHLMNRLYSEFGSMQKKRHHE